jgi:hypothetical protein
MQIYIAILTNETEFEFKLTRICYYYMADFTAVLRLRQSVQKTGTAAYTHTYTHMCVCARAHACVCVYDVVTQKQGHQ